MQCCICGKEINGYGNNPDGAVLIRDGEIVTPEFKPEDRCCDDCNSMYVITGRIYRLIKLGENKK